MLYFPFYLRSLVSVHLWFIFNCHTFFSSLLVNNILFGIIWFVFGPASLSYMWSSLFPTCFCSVSDIKGENRECVGLDLKELTVHENSVHGSQRVGVTLHNVLVLYLVIQCSLTGSTNWVGSLIHSCFSSVNKADWGLKAVLDRDIIPLWEQ